MASKINVHMRDGRVEDFTHVPGYEVTGNGSLRITHEDGWVILFPPHSWAYYMVINQARWYELQAEGLVRHG